MRVSHWVGVFVAVSVFGLGAMVRPPSARRIPAEPTVRAAWKFVDVTQELGVKFSYSEPIVAPELRDIQKLVFFGSGAAVADFDGDGWMDLLFLTPRRDEKNHLYLNQKGGGFREVAAEWGIADANAHGASVSPVVFDYDNDGRPDVFIAAAGCSKLYRNLGTQFRDVSAESGAVDCRNSVGAVPVPLTPGRLDLIVLRYWNEHSLFDDHASEEFLAENDYDAHNGGAKTWLRNLGHGTFAATPAPALAAETRWTLDGVYASLFPGDPGTLFLVNDFGADSTLEFKHGEWRDTSRQRLPAPDRRWGMGATLADLDGRGYPHVFVSNEYIPRYRQTGNHLWRFGDDGRAVDVAGNYGLQRCGWDWGAVFADFALRGRQDVYVANGFISESMPILEMAAKAGLAYEAPKPEPAPEPGWPKAEPTRPAKLAGYEFRAATVMASPGIYAMNPANWPAMNGSGFVGHEVDCVFSNEDGRFENIASQMSAIEDWDTRAVAAVDYDNNGTVDLVVTTINGPPHILRNTTVPDRRWIGFKLRGVRSNRDGAGARVEVRQGARKWFRWANAGHSGFLATSDPRLHFGIPDRGVVDLEVRWPSGVVQTRRALATGQYYEIVEGER